MKKINKDEPMYMCNCCGDLFPKEEMDMEVDDDQDLCKTCNFQSYEQDKKIN